MYCENLIKTDNVNDLYLGDLSVYDIDVLNKCSQDLKNFYISSNINKTMQPKNRLCNDLAYKLEVEIRKKEHDNLVKIVTKMEQNMLWEMKMLNKELTEQKKIVCSRVEYKLADLLNEKFPTDNVKYFGHEIKLYKKKMVMKLVILIHYTKEKNNTTF